MMRRFKLQRSSLLEIKRYSGKRDITFKNLGIIPFRSSKNVAQKQLRERLMLRERSLTEIARTTAGIWQYDGPLCLDSPFTSTGVLFLSSLLIPYALGFIRTLSLYPGVIFVCLKYEDEVDTKYQKMKPVEIRLDEEEGDSRL